VPGYPLPPLELATAGEFIVTGAGPLDPEELEDELEELFEVTGPTLVVDGPIGLGALAIFTGGASGFGGALGFGACATGGIGIGG
jgi:hypothetical protein